MRFLTLVFCFLTFSTAMAGDFVVATVDMQQLFKAYPETAPAQKKFEALTAQKKQELVDAEKVLNKLQTELTKGHLSDTAKQEKQQEFQQAAQDFDHQKNDIQTELANREEEMTQALVVEIKAVAAKVAESEGVDLVLDSHDIASLKSNMDLTADVLAKFTKIKSASTDSDKP